MLSFIFIPTFIQPPQSALKTSFFPEFYQVCIFTSLWQSHIKSCFLSFHQFVWSYITHGVLLRLTLEKSWAWFTGFMSLGNEQMNVFINLLILICCTRYLIFILNQRKSANCCDVLQTVSIVFITAVFLYFSLLQNLSKGFQLDTIELTR